MQTAVEPIFFTVYLAHNGIELRPGCEDYPDYRAIHTSRSYESAFEFAQIAATHRNLPIKNWVELQNSNP